jgi:hypothetical protein
MLSAERDREANSSGVEASLPEGIAAGEGFLAAAGMTPLADVSFVMHPLLSPGLLSASNCE